MLGTTDNFTKILLAKLILDIVTSASKKFKSAKIVLTEENVQNMLGNILPQMFADVLNIEGEVQSDASEQLNKLLSKEVTDILNCDASGSTSHITPPSKLNTIILQTFKMLKEFPGKMKKIRFLKKKKLIRLHDGDSFRFLMSKYFTQKDDQSTTAEAALRSSLTEELQEILTPFLQAIPEDQAKMVLSETSQEVEAIIDYITGNELPFQAALAELRAFFIKSFAKALIHNKVAEMKTKFPTTSSVKRKKSLQLLANNVDSLLKDLEAEKEGQGLRLVSRAERSGFTEALVGVIYSHVIEDSEHQVKAEANYPHDPQCSDVHVAVRENVKNILVLLGWWSDAQVGNCCDRVLLTLNHTNSQQREMDTHGYSDVHTDELSNANIHSNDKEDARVHSSYHEDVRVHSQDHEDAVTLSDHEDINGFFSKPEYATMHSDHHDHAAVLCDSFEIEQMKLVEKEKHKAFLDMFIKLLVWELVNKAKIVGHDMETVIQQLSEATWVNLKSADSSLFDPHRLKSARKKVYRKLCKEFGCAENLLLHLSLNDDAVHDCTVAIILCQLKIQKKPSMATKFVSWLKRVFTGSCK
ncbi:uncharacterized protein [Takifugu rubripes]|uniref:uncharacterized protein n=1 Tax=Takifugu rubripes TaxID=31033 RepID=UPI001145B15D|nr:uncharacterized protein LOC115250428 [Takifugu rubripes]